MPSVASRGRGRGRRTIAEINMVPFIDVMLVLLIIFMVTAPLISPSVINLPTVGKAAKAPDRIIQVTIDKNEGLELREGNNKKTVTQRDLATQMQGMLQAIGGGALLIGLLFSWRNLRATQLKLDIDRESQLTNRFTAATGQLGAQLNNGAPNIEARLGGIYALAAIARDSPRDYWPVMEILTAYVRHNAPRGPLEAEAAARSASHAPAQKPRTDIQAVLGVLGRSTPPEAKALRLDQKFDLRRTDLRGAEFWDAHLERTDFWGANLEGAQLWGARLDDAKLVKTQLRGANLKGVSFDRADLAEADLTGADLAEAELRLATGLTCEQLASALNQGKGARLAPGLARPGA